MPPDEATITSLEEQIPQLAQEAFREAYRHALAQGMSVVVADGTGLYEVYPDGRKEFRKLLEPRMTVVKGTVVEIV